MTHLPRWGMVLLAAASSLFPQRPPVLRTETRAVLIHVEVQSRRGQAVAGLTKGDFTVTDEGRRREVRIFSVEGGAEPAPPPPPSAALPPNVFSNMAPGPAHPAHATVILLDAINNYWDHLASARQRLITMVEKLRREERIAVYVASTRPAGIVLLQGFTTDRVQLLRTIQAYVPAVIEPAPGIYGPPRVPQLPEGPFKPAIPLGEAENRQHAAVVDTMSAFELLAEHLGKLPGRKSVLWVTSGLPPRQLRELPDPFEKAAAALNEANVAVNVMDDDGVGSPRRRWGRQAVDTLRALADSTGGKAYIGRNDLENALVEVIDAPRRTYVLGFYLSEEERDEKFHRLLVRVNRPGLELSYRRGYYASTARKQTEPLENVLLDAENSTELGIAVEVHASPAALRLDLRISAGDITLRPVNGEQVGKLEQLFFLTNAAGQPVAKVSGSKEFRYQSAVDVIGWTQEIALTGDAAHLLVVVRDAESGRTGSLSVPLNERRMPASDPAVPPRGGR